MDPGTVSMECFEASANFAKPRLVLSATVQETRQIVNTTGAWRTSEVVAFSNGPVKHLALTLPHL